MNNTMENNIINLDDRRVKEDTHLSKTGLSSLDTDFLVGGVDKGEVCLVAGRPNFGKNYTADTISINNANDDKKTLYVSISNPINVLGNDKFKNNNLFVMDMESLTVKELEDAVIYYKSRYDIDTLILNSVQLVRLNDGNIPQNKDEYVLIIDKIKTLVKGLNLSGYIFSEVNRICETREDKQPDLSDLRGYENLKEDSNYILTVCSNKPFGCGNETPDFIDVRVLKNRKGPKGLLRVALN